MAASGKRGKAPEPAPAQETEDEKTLTEEQRHVQLIRTRENQGRPGLLRSLGEFYANGRAFYEGTGWRGYDNYIGQRHFEPGFNENLLKKILQSERVTAQIRLLSQQGPPKYKGMTQKQILEEAQKMGRGLMGELRSKTTVRMMAYAVHNIFIRLYHQGIHVNEAQLDMLKETALRAEKENISLFFLPCHKSHIDYLVISYLFYRIGLSVPFVAAGENLNIPIVGQLLRSCGAFFIRRTFADDPLYNVLFKEYIAVLLSMGYNLEAFIEGTRSRTGKLLNPKFGVVKTIVETVLSGRVKDVYMCPISIGYDRVLETASYVNELLGAEKKQESLGQLLSSARILGLKLGRIDVTFGKPFSLKGYIEEQMQDRRDFNPMNNPADQMLLLKSVAFRVLMDINSVSVIMPTALVGTCLLTLRGRGVGKNELSKKVAWLRDAIVERGGLVGQFSDDEIPAIVDRSVKVLGGLVGERDLLEPVLYATKRFELSYYRNEVMHIFVEEAVLCCSLYSSQKERGNAIPDKLIPYDKLIEQVKFLSQLLKFEFIFSAGGVQVNTEKTIRRLEQHRVLESESNHVAVHRKEIMSGQEIFDFYCFLLWPYIETYWLAAVSLFIMNDKGMQVEKIYNERLQRFATCLYYQGDLSYFESINKETLKNAQQLLMEMNIIEKRVVDNTALIFINPDYQADNFRKLRELVEQIGRYRREGKHRRDTKNANDRTLRIALLASKL